jgi:ankyrin repeat protein
MAEAEFEPTAPERPEMDQETYNQVQELFQLTREGNAARVGRLLEMGLVPNLRDGQGNTLLMLASYHGHHELTRLLLIHGGDPQLPNDRSQIPLAGAAFKGDLEMARLLIEFGADVNAVSPDGKTPLMFAAMFDRLEIIDLLLEHGAVASSQTADGADAVTLAQVMGATRAAAYLAEKSAE